MKKYILILLLIAFIVPSVALASWWNPFSWFNGWTFHKEEVVVPIEIIPIETEKTPEEKISDLQKQLDELKNKQPDSNPTKTTPVIKEFKKIIPVVKTETKPNEVIDVCLNIEGVQTTVPVGYSSISSICTLIVVQDLCPNMLGIQQKIPAGKTFYRNTQECLSDQEIDAIENKNLEKQTRELQCQEAKEGVINLKKEVAELYTKYQTDSAYIMTNPNGTWGGAVENEIQKLEQKYNSDKNVIYNQIYILLAEIELYCD